MLHAMNNEWSRFTVKNTIFASAKNNKVWTKVNEMKVISASEMSQFKKL